jgi:hypothetical protein
MMRTSPPHLLHVSMSMLNTRFNLRAQVIEKVRPGTGREAGLGHARRSAGVGSGCCCAALAFLPVPRWAGVTNARYLLFGANTPLPGEVDSGFGYQSDQPGNKIQRFE